MNSPKKCMIVSFAIIFALLSVNGCSKKLDKPSDLEIEQLLKQYSVPPYAFWSPGNVGKRRWEVESIEAIEWGTFNEQEQYWPGRIRVIAKVTGVRDITNQIIRITVDKVIEVKFKKNDFGEWEIGFE